MNINQLKQSLPIMMRNNVVPFIWGMQGVGKTQVVKQVANEANVGFIHLHLATQEVGDLVGLLRHNTDGSVSHARPEWLPTGGKGILFLDELNRAHPDVIQACFSLITSKTIHMHKLPEGWSIVAAGNYQTDEFTVTDTSDSAWMSRFCHLHFEPLISEFVAYAESIGAGEIGDFISEHPEFFKVKPKTRPELNVMPDNRALIDMVYPLEKESLDSETRMEIYSGIIGMVAASRFFAFKNNRERRLRLRDILKDYDGVKERVKAMNKDKDTRYDALAAPIGELEANIATGKGLTPSEVENLKKYFLDVPKELLAQTFKKLGRVANFEGKSELLNDPVFAKRFFK